MFQLFLAFAIGAGLSALVMDYIYSLKMKRIVSQINKAMAVAQLMSMLSKKKGEEKAEEKPPTKPAATN